MLVGSPILMSEYRAVGSRAVGDINHEPGGKLPLLSARPAVTFSAVEYHRPYAWWQWHIGVMPSHKCMTLSLLLVTYMCVATVTEMIMRICCFSHFHYYCTGWAKKPDHFLKCITPVYDDVGRHSIYQNVQLFIWSKTVILNAVIFKYSFILCTR